MQRRHPCRAVDGRCGRCRRRCPSFSAVPAYVYVAKVKNILVGLPPTDAEIAAVTADPDAAEDADRPVDAPPQYTAKMQVFFELAYQQTQVSVDRLRGSDLPEANGHQRSTTPLIVQNAIESFSRTMLQLISQGAPLNQAMTTQSFMMTPALMELYAFLDVWQVDDEGNVTDGVQGRQPQRDDHRRGRGRANPDRADARPHQPELHALVRPGRRQRRRGGPRLRRRPDPLPLEWEHAAPSPRRGARRAEERDRGDLLPARGDGGRASADDERLHDLEDGHDSPAEPRREHHRLLRPADAPHGERPSC